MMEKIDLVYLWVDGNDPVWRARKEKVLKNINALHKTSYCNSRFIDTEELRYSLRSVEKNMPWINNIFIVTDKQKPDWLNTSHPSIKIIDHTDIMPKDALPCYNSTAIELCLHNIDELSEYFIYMNDDTFINTPIDSSFFFDKETGYPIIRLRNKIGRKMLCSIKSSLGLKNVVQSLKLIKSREIIEKRWGKINVGNTPHHNADAYRKSDFNSFINEFPEETKNTIYHPFRMGDDIQRIAVSYYAIKKEKGFPRKANNSESFWLINTKKNLEKILLKYNPILFCINDSRKSTNEDRMRMKNFLETKFPEKSSFEK